MWITYLEDIRSTALTAQPSKGHSFKAAASVGSESNSVCQRAKVSPKKDRADWPRIIDGVNFSADELQSFFCIPSRISEKKHAS